jgi:hypothetical protein
MSGPVNRDALVTAVADVVHRHEPLRTVFSDEEGTPYQRVLVDARPWTQVVDVDRAELDTAVAAASGHVFDLAAEPP